MQNTLKFNENSYIFFAKLQKNMIICKMVMILSRFFKPSKIRQKIKMRRRTDLFAIENPHEPHGTKYEPKRTNIFIGRSVRPIPERLPRRAPNHALQVGGSQIRKNLSRKKTPKYFAGIFYFVTDSSRDLPPPTWRT